MSIRPRAPLLAILLCGGAMACGEATVSPSAPVTLAPLPAPVARLALTLDVPTASHGALGRLPSGEIHPVATTLDRPRCGDESPAPWSWQACSLVGVDGVVVDVGAVERSVLGQHLPGKVRVRLALRLRNRLDRTDLWTPTWPLPPAGDGLYVFALQSAAVESPGGVTVSSNSVQVQSPSRGAVTPGPEWDGPLYDYLRSTTTTCGTASSSCAPWKRFAAPLRATARSEWRTVSYDIDPTVHHMRLRLVVGADLANAAP